MIRSDNKLKMLSEIIQKGSNIEIPEAILLLREEHPFEGAIGLLTKYYNEIKDNSIRKAIADFLNDIKDPSARSEIMNEIRKPWNDDTISMLVSSCWQSGLNYAEYSMDFARVFLTGDYVTSVECLTVIEESAPELSGESKNEIIKFIEESPVQPVNEKTALKLELISILGG
jgi:hypothetical protein